MAHIWEQSKECTGETSNSEISRRTWKKFWRTKISSSIKLVTWRLFYEGLPTAENLRRRGCEIETECALCSYRVENTKHTFLECWWSCCIWNKLELNSWTNRNFSSISDWIWCFLRSADSETIRKMAITIWIIWKNRNLAVHNKPIWTIEQCANKMEILVVQQEKNASLGTCALLNESQDDSESCTFFCDGSWSKSSMKGGYATIGIKHNLVEGCRAEAFESLRVCCTCGNPWNCCRS